MKKIFLAATLLCGFLISTQWSKVQAQGDTVAGGQPSTSSATSSNSSNSSQPIQVSLGYLTNVGQSKNTSRDYVNIEYNSTPIITSGKPITTDDPLKQVTPVTSVQQPTSGVPGVSFNNGLLSASGGLLNANYSKQLPRLTNALIAASVEASSSNKLVEQGGIEYSTHYLDWLNKGLFQGHGSSLLNFFIVDEHDNSQSGANTGTTSTSQTDNGLGGYYCYLGTSLTSKIIKVTKSLAVSDFDNQVAQYKKTSNTTDYMTAVRAWWSDFSKNRLSNPTKLDLILESVQISLRSSGQSLNTASQQSVEDRVAVSIEGYNIDTNIAYPQLAAWIESEGWYQPTGTIARSRFDSLLSVNLAYYFDPKTQNLSLNITYEDGRVRLNPTVYNRFVAATLNLKFD